VPAFLFENYLHHRDSCDASENLKKIVQLRDGNSDNRYRGNMQNSREFESRRNVLSEWVCPICGKSNFGGAKFCGGCGKSRLQLFPHDFTTIPQSEGLFSGKLVSWMIRSTNRPTASFSYKKLAAIMIGLALATFALSPILALQSKCSPVEKFFRENQINWGEFRSYLSRKLGLTLSEVEKIAQKAFSALPEAEQLITCDQVKAIERTLSEWDIQFRQLLRLLPEKGPFLRLYLEDFPQKTEAPFFNDVPLDHPVYLAWKALLNQGIPLKSQGNADEKFPSASPFDPITWEDWNPVLQIVSGNLNEEFISSQLGLSNPSGPIPREILKKCLAYLARAWEVSDGTGQLNLSSLPNPTRLEAFAALSELLERKMAQR